MGKTGLRILCLFAFTLSLLGAACCTMFLIAGLDVGFNLVFLAANCLGLAVNARRLISGE